ncbi:MAG: 30S ribosomal protein S5 [Candidatus Peregrinibacteria bacterium]|nr:30S ribosomal protein S5 [Candidatus Peregrinibacteria bacterium]
MGKEPHKKARGPRIQEPKEFDEVVIQLDRVTRVVKGGRRLRFRATVAIGNRKGKVGVGVAKSAEVVGAIQKAVAEAKKNLVEIPMYEDTIPHRIQVKYKASKILLMPAGPGTGIIAGGATRKIIELSGIKNILSKTIGSSNRLNNSKATLEALKQLRSRKVYKPTEEKEESNTEVDENQTTKKKAETKA